MTVRVWRIVKPKWVATAYDGEGARRDPGRWNRAGVPVAYASATASLAVLEVLVHLKVPGLQYALVPATFDDAGVEELDPVLLPGNWRDYPAPERLAEIGSDWARSLRSPILKVPSAIIDFEFNYLLNPLHPGFSAVQVGEPIPFRLDPRLEQRPA